MGEAAARLQVHMADMLEILQKGLIEQHSVTTLNEMKEKKQYGDYLALVERFSECMPFLPHDDLCEVLSKSWNVYLDVLNNDRKNMRKKVSAMRDDKKTDPEVLAKNEGLMDELNVRRANAVTSTIRFKAMNSISINQFIENKDLDAAAIYDDAKTR
jgi:hypothetical protein